MWHPKRKFPKDEPKVEHSLLVYRMGSRKYLGRCLEEGLEVDFTTRNPDPLSVDNRALEPIYAPWMFRRLKEARFHLTTPIPLPTPGLNDIQLTACKTGSNVVAEHKYIVVKGCRAYYVPVSPRDSNGSSQYICHYAVPMYLLDLMERCSTGYNMFYHRAECLCYTGFSSMAVQMGP